MLQRPSTGYSGMASVNGELFCWGRYFRRRGEGLGELSRRLFRFRTGRVACHWTMTSVRVGKLRRCRCAARPTSGFLAVGVTFDSALFRDGLWF